ncbi:hypothetical protein DAEQUDRAFT_359991 [Daedalea quercina L-15889]|uniref:Uncharacterized protein n=1 Tax=Daedalea quercina L-15889 TaxID=1314783 RepID=A0A165TSW5_9APHY|nr:hypothetical protein DAEQUDRAFT_359991 [Daedalea quercina L-15889]
MPPAGVWQEDRAHRGEKAARLIGATPTVIEPGSCRTAWTRMVSSVCRTHNITARRSTIMPRYAQCPDARRDRKEIAGVARRISATPDCQRRMAGVHVPSMVWCVFIPVWGRGEIPVVRFVGDALMAGGWVVRRAAARIARVPGKEREDGRLLLPASGCVRLLTPRSVADASSANRLSIGRLGPCSRALGPSRSFGHLVWSRDVLSARVRTSPATSPQSGHYSSRLGT